MYFCILCISVLIICKLYLKMSCLEIMETLSSSECIMSFWLAAFHFSTSTIGCMYSEKQAGWICKSAARICSGVTNLAICLYALSIKHYPDFLKLAALSFSLSWNFWQFPTLENWLHIIHLTFCLEEPPFTYCRVDMLVHFWSKMVKRLKRDMELSSGNLVVKSKLPPGSGSSFEAVEPHP